MSIYVEKRPVRAKLGRHVGHDSRSLNYLFPETVSDFTPVKWESEIDILDQGDLGACTGFATAGCLGHKPYRDTIASVLLDNAEGVTLYSAATRLDPYAGTYPPTDTGSDGLSAAKAAKKLGLISGYLHITTAKALASALQSGPVIVGTDWYESMFSTYANGYAVFDPASGVAGGHEYVLDEVTADGAFGFTNSWGTSYGVNGRFYLARADFLSLLANKGDATHFVPVTAPAPTPTPPPAPPEVDANTLAAYRALQAWAKDNKVT